MEINLSLPNDAKDNLIATIIFFVSIVLFIFIIAYLIYLSKLNSRECDFMTDTYGTLDGYIKSINTTDPDCSGNLRDYYIKTAYNCCNGGSYKNDFVNICNLKNVLKQGVRCLDFEIYSIDDQPVVASAVSENYNVKETFNKISFSDVMNTIKTNAFASGTVPNPDDPLLLHLRFQSTNQTMYTNLAEILQSYDDLLLGNDYSFESGNQNITKVALSEFMKKIIIIVDRSNTSFVQNDSFLEFVNLTSSSAFMRNYRYSDAKNNPDIEEITVYNKRNMTIILPDKTSNPENPSSPYAYELGCQMVAMRFQYIDSYLQQNVSFFDRCGYAFCLKPYRLRYHPEMIAPPKDQEKRLSYGARNSSTDFYNISY